MLTLVPVTVDDVDVLFEVVAFSNVPEKEILLAGLIQMGHHFRATKDKVARMVLIPSLLGHMRTALDTFMPADALRNGIPSERSDYIFRKIPEISRKLALPEFFQVTGPEGPQKVLLN